MAHVNSVESIQSPSNYQGRMPMPKSVSQIDVDNFNTLPKMVLVKIVNSILSKRQTGKAVQLLIAGTTKLSRVTENVKIVQSIPKRKLLKDVIVTIVLNLKSY